MLQYDGIQFHCIWFCGVTRMNRHMSNGFLHSSSFKPHNKRSSFVRQSHLARIVNFWNNLEQQDHLPGGVSYDQTLAPSSYFEKTNAVPNIAQ